MNKHLQFLIIFAIQWAILECSPFGSVCFGKSEDCISSSISYFFTRPLFQSVSPEMIAGFRENSMYARHNGIHGALETVLFGSKSTNSNDIARYLFPFFKSTLIVDERIASADKDLLAQHFNIFTNDQTFRSAIAINPQQSVIGLGLQYRQSFWKNQANTLGVWGSISFPIERLTNTLQFCERVINNGNGPNKAANTVVVANMTQALNQKEFAFGKLCPVSMHKIGVADIECKVGYSMIQDNFETYIGFVIPTGNKPDPTFLFSPVIGNGHHWTIMAGGAGSVLFWSDQAEQNYISLEYAANGQYFFGNTQCRSFDLKGKPWSRYIQLYANKEQAKQAQELVSSNVNFAANGATPGINLLTQPVQVKPGFSHSIIMALLASINSFEGEMGYNLFCKTAECVQLTCPWQQGSAIKHFLGKGRTNPLRTICGNPIIEGNTINIGLAQYDSNIIKQEDIDLSSASHPSILTHTFYSALGYHANIYTVPTFITGGASYEFAQNTNAALNRWVVWIKGSCSF